MFYPCFAAVSSTTKIIFAAAFLLGLRAKSRMVGVDANFKCLNYDIRGLGFVT